MNQSTRKTEGTKRSLPLVKSAAYIDGYRVELLFTDGQTGVVNLEPLLWGEIFQPLHELSAFCRFTVDAELGTIVWPNGADIAPDTLYRMIT